MDQSNKKVILGVPVKPGSPGTQIDWAPFVDCLQARNRFDLASRLGVLGYRIGRGDIFKKTS